MFMHNLRKSINSKLCMLIQLAFILLWGGQLLYSDAYYICYVFIMVIAGICCYKNSITGDSFFRFKKNIIITVFSILFSCMVSFANYKVWWFTEISEEYSLLFDWCYCIINTTIFFVGGYLAFWHIINAIINNLKIITWNKVDKSTSPMRIFIISFFLFVLTRCLVLFLCQYPGELTNDSIGQITQILNGNYTNHHPYYHTMVIKVFISLGLRLFNDINAAVATYCFFQIIFTSICFSFAISTMSHLKTPRWIIVLSLLFFLLMPYHIIYSITIWKDIMFGCFVLLFVTFIYRCMEMIGNQYINYSILIFSGGGICLFRSNGFFVFVVLSFLFAVIWKLNEKGFLFVFLGVLLFCFIMKHLVLKELGVVQPDTIESLSIPAQQISRVIQEGYEINQWEADALEEVIEVDRISEVYNSEVSDPIKALVREKGNQRLIVDNKEKYIRLYMSLGLRYPTVYLRAWIDQTRGYWNAGYEFWRWDLNIRDNDLGIERNVKSSSFNRMFNEYLWLFTNVQGLRLFLCIGLFVWIDIFMLMIAIIRKDKLGAFVSLPIITIVLSLLIATPVFSEFRYIYSAFCTLPIVVVIVLRRTDDIIVSEIQEKEGI